MFKDFPLYFKIGHHRLLPLISNINMPHFKTTFNLRSHFLAEGDLIITGLIVHIDPNNHGNREIQYSGDLSQWHSQDRPPSLM